jgi:uncharacterized membrane protein
MSAPHPGGRAARRNPLGSALALAALAACELGTHYAASRPGAQTLGMAAVLAPLLAVSLAAALRPPRRAWLLGAWGLGCAVLWHLRGPLAAQFAHAAFAEHAGVMLALAYGFGRTLAHGRVPLCSEFAAAIHGELPPAVARYTRGLTLVWSVFFALLAALSTLLYVAAPLKVWSTFANYLTLPLVAALFVGEHAWRRVVLPDVERPGMLAVARACRHTMDARAQRAS